MRQTLTLPETHPPRPQWAAVDSETARVSHQRKPSAPDTPSHPGPPCRARSLQHRNLRKKPESPCQEAVRPAVSFPLQSTTLERPRNRRIWPTTSTKARSTCFRSRRFPTMTATLTLRRRPSASSRISSCQLDVGYLNVLSRLTLHSAREPGQEALPCVCTLTPY
jgi:hypothetical protein